MLSNVGDYVDDNTFEWVIQRLYKDNLNPGGKIQAYYNFVQEYNYKGRAYNTHKFCPNSTFALKDIFSSSNYLNRDGHCIISSINKDISSVEFIEKPCME